MNTPNPLIPQGTFPENRGRSHIRIAVFAILAVHVVLLGGLLMLGCRKQDQETVDKGPTNTYNPLVLPPESNPPIVVQTSAPPTAITPAVPTTPTPGTEPSITSPATEHVIVKGDSFYVLGKKYGVSTKAIVEANPGVDSSKLKIGQKIKIPAGSGSSATAAPLISSAGTSSSGSEKTYTVKSGDNLLKIAKANGTSVKVLRSANALKTDQIKVGQKIKIPAKASAPMADTTSSPTVTATNPAP